MELPSKSNIDTGGETEWTTVGHWTNPYFGYVDTLEQTQMVLKTFTEATKSRFVVYQKEKSFGAREFNLNKNRIFFRATKEQKANPMSVWPEFDGIPFIILGRKIFGCHLGKDKDYGAKLKLREARDQMMSPDSAKVPLRATKKLGCPAKISMVQIIKFVEYKVEKLESEVQRREIFKKLHNDVNKDPTALKYEVRYYIKMSRPQDHSHPIVQFKGDEINRDSMDYRLVRHLCNLHHQGISRLSEVEKGLSQYVEETLYPDGDAPPKGIYPGLYPNRVAIQYHINNAKCTEQLIEIDTKMFNKVVEEWRDVYPTHSFYYQAHIKEKSVKTEQPVKEHHYARDMVEPRKLQSFMFCYQSDTQQRLLTRFGQNFAVLDTTNKIPVPAYLLMVRTNTCYQVVAMILLQFPFTPGLEQALRFLREVNPGWNPQSLVVHNTQEDIGVLQQVFPDAEIHVLDSCLQNSLKKWLRRNCKEESDMENVYQLVQETAMSRTEEESNQAWEKVTQLGLWRFNASFRYYMTHTWLEHKKRWCHYSKSESLIVTLTANDGLEQLSSALKHDWLDELKTRSLTEILSGIVAEFLPAHYCKHVSQNLVLPALANQNSKKLSVPKYIKNIPLVIQAHITELIKTMPSTAEVTKQAAGHFTVIFPDRPSYNLTYGNELQFPSCSCSHWQETRMICHHFCVIFGSFPDYGWNALSVRYINNPIFRCDVESLPVDIQTLYKVDNLQQQAEMAHNELQEAKQVIVGGELDTTQTDDDGTIILMEIIEDDKDDDTSDGEGNPIVSTEIEAPESTAEEETTTASQNISFTDDIPIVSDEGPVQAELIIDTTLESERTLSQVNEQISAKCKHHLQTLGNSVDHINDTDALVRLEQQLAYLVQEVMKSKDVPVSKRRKLDPD